MLILLALSKGAMAQEAGHPQLSGELAIEVENDYVYDTTGSANELNDLFTESELDLVGQFSPHWSLTALGILEPVTDPRESRFFEDHEFFIEELHLRYERDRFFLRGGKFTPNFGIAWDIAPGIYGDDLADEYEFTERIGFGGGLRFSHETTGTHILTASTFFVDTTLLSGSVFTDRGRTELSDGGPGNTEDFSSFALAYEGSGIPPLQELDYHLAVIHQAAGRRDTADETGLAIGLSHSSSLTHDLALDALWEYVRFANAEGLDDQERHYLTMGGEFQWQSWNLALVYTGKHTETPRGEDSDASLFQVSAGYTFIFGSNLQVGWRQLQEEGSDSETVGVLLTHTIAF